MFRKYTMMATAMLLASTINVSLAEDACCEMAQQGAISTCETICSSICQTNTTLMDSSATNMDCNATYGAFCEVISAYVPTEFPQKDALSVPAATQLPSTGDDYTTQSVSAQEQMMMNLLNQDRKNNGLAPLTLDAELSRIARIKSADMRDEGYFAHESPTYGNVRSMLKHFVYPFAAAGENIAHHANVDKAQAAFMSSQGHRANILSKAWTKVGVGIVYDAQGYIYATQIFAR